MGSQRRREAIAQGLPVENAEATRRRRRAEAAIVREELAIEMWAKGNTAREISDAMLAKYGVRLVSNIPELVRRGLYRRVEEGSANVEVARERFRELYSKALRRWFPLAVPDDDATTPDPVAMAQVLRIMRDWGAVEGVVAPPRSGDINLNILSGVQMDDQEMRDKVLASLHAEHEKQVTIDGELAGTPAGAAEEADDGKVPPPVILPKRPD